MKSIYKNIVKKIIKIVLLIYISITVYLFFAQESIIFPATKLAKDYKFSFYQDFEEVNIKSDDGIILNGALFKAKNSKGLLFYLHGNSGSLKKWGNKAELFTNLGYDTFIFDYRGYGKSEGKINNEKQFYQDAQIAYDEMKKKYKEENIVILGYSVGSASATFLATNNSPSLLILQAPYYSLIDMMKQRYPLIPTFILKYKFETSKYLKDCKVPVVIFHGTKDKVIYYGSSLKLKKYFKPQDKLITIDGFGHSPFSDNSIYKLSMKEILK